MCYPLISDKSFVPNRWCYSQLNISLIEPVLFSPSLSSGPIIHNSKISHTSHKISSRIYTKDSYGCPKVFSLSFCLLCRTYIGRLLNSSNPNPSEYILDTNCSSSHENPLKSLSKGICYSKICTSIGHYIITQLYEAVASLSLPGKQMSQVPYSGLLFLQVFEVCCGPWVQWPTQPPYPPEGQVYDKQAITFQ